MKAKVFKKVKLDFSAKRLAPKFFLKVDAPEFSEFETLLDELLQHTNPVAIIQTASIVKREGNTLVTSAGNFHSALLVDLTNDCKEVFPFIATCGCELEEFTLNITDPLHLYWADKFKELVLEKIFYVAKAYAENLCPDKLVTSLVPLDNDVWSLDGLNEVFASFNSDELNETGVSLSKDFYMEPCKSRAGLFFPAPKEVDLCDTCNVKKCKDCPVAYNKDGSES